MSEYELRFAGNVSEQCIRVVARETPEIFLRRVMTAVTALVVPIELVLFLAGVLVDTLLV